MLKQARGMLGRAEIGARVGPTNLANRILEVALEVHARTHFVHQLNIHRRLDDTAPARNQQAALALERTERRGLEHTKTVLALGLKNLGYRLAATAHDEAVLIGDQLYTDVWSGNFAGVDTILVKPQATQDLWYTQIFRIFERRALRDLPCEE